MNLSEARQILGVSSNTSKDDIKKAYRTLAMKYHPDRHSDGDKKEASDKFAKISQAHEILSDPEKAARANRGNGFGAWQDMRKKKFNPHQVGEDIFHTMTITLEEAANGVKKTITIDRPVSCKGCSGNGLKKDKERSECPSCKGLGMINHTQRMFQNNFVVRQNCPVCRGVGSYIEPKNACEKCSGKRFQSEKRNIDIELPKGSRKGMRFGSEGDGGEGLAGGPNGRLFISVDIKDHEYYKFEKDNSNNLRLDYDISYYQHYFGDEIDLNTIYGNTITVIIPPKHNLNDPITIKGYGFPPLGGLSSPNNFKGDLLVYINVKAPESKDGQEEKIIEQLNYKVANKVDEYKKEEVITN